MDVGGREKDFIYRQQAGMIAPRVSVFGVWEAVQGATVGASLVLFGPSPIP